MSDIKKSINALRKALDRFNQDFSKALSALEKTAISPASQTMLTGITDLKTSIKQLFEKQKSMKLNEIKKVLRVGTLAELKPSVGELVKEGSLGVDESTLGKRGDIIGTTTLHAETGNKVILSEKDLPKILKETYEEIRSTESRFSDLIPLSILKQKLYEKYPFSDELVNQTLLELEKLRKIDLQVAYDAGSLTGAEYGIKIPGRGLISYVRWRR